MKIYARSFIHDTDEPDALPMPEGMLPAEVGAAQNAIAHARISGSVGATWTGYGVTAEARRLYTVENGTNRATNLWLVQTGPSA